jgi:hypothetical protein
MTNNTKRVRQLFVCLLSALTLTSLLVAQRTGAQKPAARPTGAVVFLVESPRAGEVQIEPILRASGARLSPPYTDVENQTENKRRINAAFYPRGRTYTLIFGGGRAGEVAVKAPQTGECEPTSASVTLNAPTVKLGGNVMALATDGKTLGRADSARRPPTPEERAAVGKLVQSLYRQHGVAASAAGSFQAINLTATDLNGDGAFELIGTFKLKPTPDTSDMLFVIAEPQGADFRAGVANYEEFKSDEDPFADNADAYTNIGAAGFLFEVLIDQLDLDGDGTGEVFTRNLSFEGVNFYVYRKAQGRWLKRQEFYTYHCVF